MSDTLQSMRKPWIFLNKHTPTSATRSLNLMHLAAALLSGARMFLTQVPHFLIRGHGSPMPFENRECQKMATTLTFRVPAPL
jgi:hypothetical protein